MVNIVSQHFDYLRVGIAGKGDIYSALLHRFDYLDIRKVNHFGKWFVDFTGNALAVMRVVDDYQSAMDELTTLHWSRLDVAFNVLGVDLDKIPHPGTVISNDGETETVYSHKLRSRGDYPAFVRAYDATKAGHAEQPIGSIRFEVEFKMHLPDAIREQENWRTVAFFMAAQQVKQTFGVDLAPSVDLSEYNAPKRVIQPDREKFYARFGNGILLDIERLGCQGFVTWVRECRGLSPRKSRE